MKNDTWQIVANDIRTIEQDDDGLTYLWLAQESSEPVRYVTMVRSTDPHEEVYVERDDQRWACYGGIRRIEVSLQGMVIHLNEKGQEKLGSSERLDVAFDQEAQPDEERIRTLLGVLFGESSPVLSESR